jgi:four helix bundle protein
LNIAQGASEFSASEKARFYRMAKRCATESAAIRYVCGRLQLVERARYQAGRDLLLRSVAMLVQMVGRIAEPGTGSGTGTK